MSKEKIVLAYSGGLDTSVAIAWLKNKDYDVIACCIDVGEGKDLEAIKGKGLQVGAWKSVVIDAKRDFAEQFVLPALQAHAMYEQSTHQLQTCIGLNILYLEAGIHALAPEMKIEDPIRDWHWSREEEIQYAKDNGIPVPITKASPYSIDENLWGRANECGILEDPWAAAPADAYDRTVSIEEAPDTPTTIEITFNEGVPTAIDGEEMPLDQLIMKLDKLAGSHGIGRIDHVENRLVGIKSREIYECPAATVLLAAHKDLEDLTQEREVAHFKPLIEQKMSEIIYNGLWYSPLMKSLVAFIDESQAVVNGVVRVKLFKGNVICEGRKSPNSLYDKNLATYTSADEFDQEAATGFIKLWELPDKVYAQVQNKNKKKVKENTSDAY